MATSGDASGKAAAAKVPEWQVPDDKPSSMPWLEVEDVTCGFCTKVRSGAQAGGAMQGGGGGGGEERRAASPRAAGARARFRFRAALPGAHGRPPLLQALLPY